MPRYHRVLVAGATYFFTVVTHRRQPILCDPLIRAALREGIARARKNRPFHIDAWVLLPDHLHCMWTMPEGDTDYPTRWSIIKRHVSRTTGDVANPNAPNTPSRRKHRESMIWQRRYWEHLIRDDEDYRCHMDYIHYNPVKHGLSVRPSDWPWSTLHRHVERGIYAPNWADNPDFQHPLNAGE